MSLAFPRRLTLRSISTAAAIHQVPSRFPVLLDTCPPAVCCSKTDQLQGFTPQRGFARFFGVATLYHAQLPWVSPSNSSGLISSRPGTPCGARTLLVLQSSDSPKRFACLQQGQDRPDHAATPKDQKSGRSYLAVFVLPHWEGAVDS